MIKLIPRGIELRHQFKPLPPEDRIRLSVEVRPAALHELARRRRAETCIIEMFNG